MAVVYIERLFDTDFGSLVTVNASCVGVLSFGVDFLSGLFLFLVDDEGRLECGQNDKESGERMRYLCMYRKQSFLHLHRDMAFWERK